MLLGGWLVYSYQLVPAVQSPLFWVAEWEISRQFGKASNCCWTTEAVLVFGSTRNRRYSGSWWEKEHTSGSIVLQIVVRSGCALLCVGRFTLHKKRARRRRSLHGSKTRETQTKAEDFVEGKNIRCSILTGRRHPTCPRCTNYVTTHVIESTVYVSDFSSINNMGIV